MNQYPRLGRFLIRDKTQVVAVGVVVSVEIAEVAGEIR
jgi:translation elongation factor EF-1alpha